MSIQKLKFWISIAAFMPQLAFAHAHLKNANPKEKAVIFELPSQVVLKFSEELEPALCKIEVKDLGSGKSLSVGETEAVGESKDILQVKLAPLEAKKAKFQVSWKVVSKDGHKMKGTYEFTLDQKVQ